MGVIPVTVSPSRPGADVRATAVAVYLAMWSDMVEAGHTADHQSPKLAQHAASQALQLLYGGLLRAHQKNVVIKESPRSLHG